MSKKFLFPVILITISSLFARTTIRPPEAKAPTQIKQKAGGPLVALPGGPAGTQPAKVEPLLPGLSSQEKELVTLALEELRLYQFALETFFQGKGEVKTAIDKGFESLKRAQLDLEKRVSSRRAGGYSGYGGASGGYRAAPYRSSGYGGSSGSGYGGYSGSRGYGGYSGSSGYGGYSGSRGYGGSSYSPSSTTGWGSSGTPRSSRSTNWNIPSDSDDKKETSPGSIGSTANDTAEKTAQKNRITTFNQEISRILTNLNREHSAPDLTTVSKLVDSFTKRSEAISTFEEKEKKGLIDSEEESAWRTFTPQLIQSMTLGDAALKTKADELLGNLKNTYTDQEYSKLVQDSITKEDQAFFDKLGKFNINSVASVPKKLPQELTQLAERIRIFQTQNQLLKAIVSKILGPAADKPAQEEAEHAEQTGRATAATEGPATTAPTATPGATPGKKAKKKEKPLFETKEDKAENARRIAENQRLITDQQLKADTIKATLTILNTPAVDQATYETMRTQATHNLAALTTQLKPRRYPILPPISGELEAWGTFIGKLLSAIEVIPSDGGTPKNISIDGAAITPGKDLLKAIKDKDALKPTLETRITERERMLEGILQKTPVSLTDTHTFDIVGTGGVWGFLGMGRRGLARGNQKNLKCLEVAQKARNLNKFGVLKSEFLKTFLAKMNEKNEYWILV